MALYDFCSLDSGGMHVSKRSFECADDVEAATMAKGTIGAGGLAEIWLGSRNVGIVHVPFCNGR